MVTVKTSGSLWKGVLAIVLIVAAGLGIWAYQTSRQLTLGWDPLAAGVTTVTAIRIYDISLQTPVLVAEAACTVTPYSCPVEVAFTMPRAAHSYVARYWDGFWESADSNAVTIPGPVNPPTGLIKK
jgi:hypothetical protein